MSGDARPHTKNTSSLPCWWKHIIYNYSIYFSSVWYKSLIHLKCWLQIWFCTRQLMVGSPSGWFSTRDIWRGFVGHSEWRHQMAANWKSLISSKPMKTIPSFAASITTLCLLVAYHGKVSNRHLTVVSHHQLSKQHRDKIPVSTCSI